MYSATTQLKDEEVIIDINTIPHLYKLQITQSNDNSVHLTKMGGLVWDHLNTLSLCSVGLGNKGIKNLIKAHMPNLSTVEISLITDS